MKFGTLWCGHWNIYRV